MLSANEKIFYKLHYKKIKTKINRSLGTIKKFLTLTQKPYIAVSWGKDSLVCLDLARKINPDVEIVWVDRGEGGDIPDVYDMVRYYKNIGVNIRRIKTNKSPFALLKKYSIEEINEKKLITKQLKTAFEKITHEYDGFMWGLRVDEAKGRKKLLLPRGPIFKKKNGLTVCSPVMTWKARDIWAYICVKNIRYCSFYDLVSEKDFDREHIRYANWAGCFNIENGKYYEVRKNYPELFNKLVQIKPIVQGY